LSPPPPFAIGLEPMAPQWLTVDFHLELSRFFHREVSHF